jgi:hypothetical protein
MLSVFPGILFLAPLSAFLIRVALALVLAYAARRHFSITENAFRFLAAIEFVAAISVGAGAWTQVGALAGMLISMSWLYLPNTRPISFIATLLVFVLSLSLILTGAGPFAFDRPL